MKTAGIFPGQGSEYPGMINCLIRHNIAEDVFSKINSLSGRDIFRIASKGTEEELREPLTAQLAVFGASVCYWNILKNKFDFYGLAGHSLGFYSALYASGALSLDDCIRIIARVHEAIVQISNNSSGLMAAIIGLRTEDVENICSNEEEVFISNINSASQTVISGSKYSVRKACETALRAGALNAKELPIHYPLHCKMMDGIEDMLRPFIAKLKIQKPLIPVISHIDNNMLNQDTILDLLCTQLSKRVLWRNTIKYFSDAKISRFLEIGPSDVLSKLVKWIERDAESLNAEEVLNCRSA